MSGTITILGVDPGFASFGWAEVVLSPDPRATPYVQRGGVISTEKSSALRSMLASEDNVQRCNEILEWLYSVVTPGVDAVAVESMSWPRNAGAAVKVALAWGCLIAKVKEHHLALLQASPQHVKKVMCGARNASKIEVEQEVLRRTECAGPIADKLRKGDREHFFDAVAVALAVSDNEAVKLLMRRAA